MKPKIAFVVQRCGLEVNGGAESMCLAIALRMSELWDIEILTTCAQDYMTWANVYPEGVSEFNGIRLRRFPVDSERDIAAFNRMSDRLLPSPSEASFTESEEWMGLQGPLSSRLIEWVGKNHERFDAFFFYTYLYATTYYVLPLVSHKAVLIPNAHDEPMIYLPIFRKTFDLPRLLVCNTREELEFLENLFHPLKPSTRIVGVGVDIGEAATVAPEDIDVFRSRHNLQEKFVLYVGRIDPSKGCAQLFEYWKKYKALHPSPLKLVLAGKAQMRIPASPDIVELGFVDDLTKAAAIASCEVLINPSPYESLSIVLLEAWMQEKLTLVNGACAVLKAQTLRSNGGLWYENDIEFALALDYLLGHIWSFDGLAFVQRFYSWSAIKLHYQDILSTLQSLRQSSGRLDSLKRSSVLERGQPSRSEDSL